MPAEPTHILLVEDSPDDAELAQRFLRREIAEVDVTWVDDGEPALDLLRDATRRPHLVLLDLGLTRVDGAEVLEVMKSDRALRDVPVLLLTARSLARTRGLDADGYAGKPLDPDTFWPAIRLIRRRGLLDETHCVPLRG